MTALRRVVGVLEGLRVRAKLVIRSKLEPYLGSHTHNWVMGLLGVKLEPPEYGNPEEGSP